jgi:hypothetical protein
VTDDPWRKPTPDTPNPPHQPPPVYGPPPGYGPSQPYGPPAPSGLPPSHGQPGAGPPPGYPPFDPYRGPLPQRGSITRLVWILCTAGVLVLGGCGVGIYYLVKTVGKNADEVNAFLRNVRDRQFDLAYTHLCPVEQGAEAQSQFVKSLRSAAALDHPVTSFDITSVHTNATNGVTTRTAGGNVTFQDGQTRFVTFDLGKSGGHLCISSGYRQLF